MHVSPRRQKLADDESTLRVHRNVGTERFAVRTPGDVALTTHGVTLPPTTGDVADSQAAFAIAAQSFSSACVGRAVGEASFENRQPLRPRLVEAFLFVIHAQHVYRVCLHAMHRCPARRIANLHWQHEEGAFTWILRGLEEADLCLANPVDVVAIRRGLHRLARHDIHRARDDIERRLGFQRIELNLDVVGGRRDVDAALTIRLVHLSAELTGWPSA